MKKYIKCEINNMHIAIVTLNRPETLNALNEEILTELYDVLEKLNGNSEIKVIILTGSGEKAFAAGADIAAMKDMDCEKAKAFSKLGQKTMDIIWNMRPFVIAAINGYALGGGCELALSCDMRVASENAKIGIPEVALGVFPGFGGTQRLPRLVGIGVAKEMLATGRQVNAEEAFRIGLINEIVPQKKLLLRCMELANKISKNSTVAINYGKQAINLGTEMSLEKGLEVESCLFGTVFTMQDQKEGMEAFLEKRKPMFE